VISPRRGCIALALLAGCASAPNRHPARAAAEPCVASRHVVVVYKKASGFHETACRDGGVTHRFRYDDRSWGTDLTIDETYGRDGTLQTLFARGKTPTNPSFAEQFRLEAGEAVWSADGAVGRARVTGPSLYISSAGAPGQLARLVRRLLLQPDRTLPLLPRGRAQLREHQTIDVGGERVTLHGIEGLDFTPTYVWLRADGTMFAQSDGTYVHVVPEGREGVLERLVDEQAKTERGRVREAATTFSRRPRKGWILRSARIFDARSGTVQAGKAIVIEGDRIARVIDDRDVVVAPGYEVVTTTAEQTVLPGLWDMHRHYEESSGPLALGSGVTTVRDLGHDLESMNATVAAIADGRAIGPHILRAGVIDGRGPLQAPAGLHAENEAEAREAVAKYADAEYRHIKIYSSLSPAIVPIVVGEARRRKMRVSGHVPTGLFADDAVRLGFDEIHHITYPVFSLVRSSLDPGKPGRIADAALHAAEIDLESEDTRGIVRLLKEKGVVLDPTLARFQQLTMTSEDGLDPFWQGVADRAPPAVGRALEQRASASTEVRETYRRGRRAAADLCRLFYDQGVRIVAGSDGMAGFGIIRELETYVEIGIPPASVLRMATLGAAEASGLAATTGSIEAGKIADLVVVDGNRLERITDLLRTRRVFKAGIMYDAAELYRLVGVAPAR
jgi:imidazolonepropionase-like amidohydrolase